MITAAEMKALEEQAVQDGISVQELMENAGKKVYETIKAKFELGGHQIVIFAGQGNNGGDGFVAARYFAEEAPVVVLFFGDKEKLSEEAELNYNKIQESVPILDIRDEEDLKNIRLQKSLNYIFVDALLGTGVKGKIREPFSFGIDLFNSEKAIKIAVDLPSGLNPDTGEVEDKACEVDLIVCFHDLKKGLEKFEGKTEIVDIGLDPEVKVGPL
jgi:ADP-dependent NAD(P)H-hydrate dehydratase / NAD(P)H-hydrate epimerase